MFIITLFIRIIICSLFEAGKASYHTRSSSKGQAEPGVRFDDVTLTSNKIELQVCRKHLLGGYKDCLVDIEV